LSDFAMWKPIQFAGLARGRYSNMRWNHNAHGIHPSGAFTGGARSLRIVAQLANFPVCSFEIGIVDGLPRGVADAAA
jgi:hypothetical protein